MLDRGPLSGGAARFLAGRTFAGLTARDRAGRLWISPLAGLPGFVEVDGGGLRIAATPWPGDPLHGLPAPQPVGLVAIDFAARRRLRVNGTLVGSDSTGLQMEVEEAFGNCPQYIQPRLLRSTTHDPTPARSTPALVTDLSPRHRALIGRSSTFLLGTTHPQRGSDASHRGGPAGFVGVEGRTLTWSDFPGNNMFTSLGNLEVDTSAAVLFADFDSGETLHLSGVARVAWTHPAGTPSGTPAETGRRVRFQLEQGVSGTLLPARETPDGVDNRHG